MHRFPVVFILLALVCSAGQAQTRVDQYGPATRDDIGGHLYEFAEKLKAEPRARGVIVVNKPRKIELGYFLRIVHGLGKFVETFGIPRARFDVFAGEERDRILTRIWLVREGEKRPVFGGLSLDDELRRKITEPTLFDRECIDCDNSPLVYQDIFPYGLDYFAKALKANPGSKARIIIGRLDDAGRTMNRRKLVSLVIRRLVKKNRIKRNRIEIKFTNSVDAKFYIIPRGSNL